MAEPIIFAVDDETQVLNAIERDLRRRYARGYRIISANSAETALDVVHRLKQRNDPIALFIVDQRMPGLSGTEFLKETLKFYPDARKVLLTAYADTEAAIASINSIGLDRYLTKPWDQSELYETLDNLLAEWQATVPAPYDGIRVAGALWSVKCHEVKDFLATNGIPYQWLDIEKDAVARELVKTVEGHGSQLPVVFFPDGTVLVEPDNRTLADKVGLQTRAREDFYDLIIIGGGPAGLGAAVYASSEGLRTALIEKSATGGQAGTSSLIENYLGFPNGLSGAELARRATAQARRFGTEILIPQEAKSLRLDGPYRITTLSDSPDLRCHALIIATGVSTRRLELPGIEDITGAGVYYGASLTEAANYAGQHVVVVGGANSAGQGAVYFSRYAGKVTMLVRESRLGPNMSQYLIDRIEGIENIEVLPHSEVTEVHGKTRLEAVTFVDRETSEKETLSVPAMFIFIGAVPYTKMLKGIVNCNSAGFVMTGEGLGRDGRRPEGWELKRDPYLLETNVPGIFAAGDVRQGTSRRVAAAVGEGSMAVDFVHQYLKTV